MKTLIQFKNVTISFGSVSVLRGLNLEIREGEILTILGGSGSGKSVTLKLLLGILPPDKGTIEYRGQEISTATEEQLMAVRKEIGMLFQGSALFDSLTVKDNVAYPLREHFSKSEEEIDKIVAQKLALVGLGGIGGMWPADLSGGMRKRVALARAIAADPKLILYDEPTTGLDPANTQRINNLILKMKERLKVTSIVVTHDLDSAFRVSDRLALLHDGQICFVGTQEEAKNSNNPIVQNFLRGELDEISKEAAMGGNYEKQTIYTD